MADNTTLNPGAAGDVARTLDRGSAKTQVVALDLGGTGGEGISGAAADAVPPGTVYGLPMLGIRRDADTSPVSADGDYHLPIYNAVGRLKTSNTPGYTDPVSMSISAVQAAANTPVANATAYMDVRRVSNLTFYVTGTFAGVNCIFEASLDSTNGTDGTWFGIDAKRTNANTVETTTGALSAAPVYAWESSVNGYLYARVRCTARTSGTAVWTLLAGAYATEPSPASQVTGTQPVSLTGGTVVPVTPTTTFTNSAATTNGTVTKASAGTLWSVHVNNDNAAVRYFRLYNSTTVTVGTTVPVIKVAIPAGGQAFIDGGPSGIRFGTGICWSLTTGVADTDTGAVAAGEHKVAISFT